MAYYDFLLNQWSLNKLTTTQVDNAVTKSFITTTQANTIKDTLKSV